MSSLTDLDQGGTYRPYQSIWMGSTIGYVSAPAATVNVTVGGTTTLQLGVAVVAVKFNGAVTIQLPAFKGTITATQGVLPGQFVPLPITIVDAGGFALLNPITILPAAGETISGLASITIASNFGAVTLQPNPITGSCTVVS